MRNAACKSILHDGETNQHDNQDKAANQSRRDKIIGQLAGDRCLNSLYAAAKAGARRRAIGSTINAAGVPAGNRGNRMDGIVMATKKGVSLSVGRGEKLPVSYVIGAHPIDYLVATQKQPVDEFALVGTVRGEPVPMVRGVIGTI